jgi:hypothetical protein
MYGIETSQHVGCRLTALVLEGMRFVDNPDNTIQEFCDGFPNNTTLERIEFQRCQLSDHHIAHLLDAFRAHPTLTSLNLAENHCRERGLMA